MSLTPMLASASDAVPTDPSWIVEQKIDGWRCLYRDRKLYGRSGAEITQAPYIVQALAGVPDGTVLDGELVARYAPPAEQFKLTSSILKRRREHQPSAAEPALSFVLFDALEVSGQSVMTQPLSTRRQMLDLIGKFSEDWNLVRVIEQHDASDADAYYERLVREGYEGIVAKRLDSIYSQGARNGAWLKVKPEHEMDVEVTGTYPPEAGSKYEGRAVGGITFRATHADGTTYVGRCAGMDDGLREALHTEPDQYVGRVAMVAYASVGDAGALRFPRFKRFREPADKSVADLTAQMPSNTTGRILLKRALEAEERADLLETENHELRIRLGAAAKAVGKPRRAGTRSAGKTRNYNAMTNQKLTEAMLDLGRGSGDAYARALATEANGGWSVRTHCEEAERIAKSRGLV